MAALKFRGVPGSPYTRKMLAYLRYRRIPYELLLGDQSETLGLPRPRVDLLPTFYLPDADGNLQAQVDSTPLIRRFEKEHNGRETLPADEVLGFLCDLIEDYADEWLTKAMFHYRWYFDADIDQAGSILPLWRDVGVAPEQHAKLKAFVAERQISRLYVVGSNEITAPVIEASYRRFLEVMDTLLQRQPFVLGARPSAADFAIYAQLTQLAKFDPTPAALCLAQAPRVHAWTDLVDDLSGHGAAEDGWLSAAAASDSLKPLLAEIGRTWVPALLANAEALRSGSDTMRTTIDGQPWEQPTFPYHGRCLQALRAAYAEQSEAARSAIAELLTGTGCEPLLTSA